MRLSLIAAALIAAVPAAGLAADMKFETYTSDDPILSLGKVGFSGGKTLELTVGIGSAAFRHPSDPPDMVYTLSDRGPNFTAGDAKDITGVDGKEICKGVKNCRIYPVPYYSPSIYRVKLVDGGKFRVTDVISIKDARGNPVTGMTNPLTVATTENPVDANGRKLKQDPNSIDAEGLVKLSDGSFWIGEENAPSILHVAGDGRILKRIVPTGTEKDFAAANYEVTGGLPAILAKRQGNRGIESMAISPDESELYFMVQNPLANPDGDAYKAAKNTRLFTYDRKAEKVTGEYVYQLDDPMTFRLDPSKKQNAPRVSEVMAVGEKRLIVLERTDQTTKLFEVSLSGATNILDGKWDDPATGPSLEQDGAGIVPVKKTLRLDTADHARDFPTKIEGLAILGDGSLFTINDDDFGITGERSQIVVVKGSGIKAGE